MEEEGQKLVVRLVFVPVIRCQMEVKILVRMRSLSLVAFICPPCAWAIQRYVVGKEYVGNKVYRFHFLLTLAKKLSF